jgi:hypothetical protein
MGAIELPPAVEQPSAHAPFSTTNLILGAAEALGRLARLEAVAAGKSLEEARLCGHAVTVSRLALALDDLVTTQGVLVKALQRLVDDGDVRDAAPQGAVKDAMAALARANGGTP